MIATRRETKRDCEHQLDRMVAAAARADEGIAALKYVTVLEPREPRP